MIEDFTQTYKYRIERAQALAERAFQDDPRGWEHRYYVSQIELLHANARFDTFMNHIAGHLTAIAGHLTAIATTVPIVRFTEPKP